MYNEVFCGFCISFSLSFDKFFLLFSGCIVLLYVFMFPDFVFVFLWCVNFSVLALLLLAFAHLLVISVFLCYSQTVVRAWTFQLSGIFLSNIFLSSSKQWICCLSTSSLALQNAPPPNDQSSTPAVMSGHTLFYGECFWKRSRWWNLHSYDHCNSLHTFSLS